MNTKQIVEKMEKELEKEMGIDTWNDGKWIKSGQIMLSKDFFNHIRPHISSLLSAFAEEVIGKDIRHVVDTKRAKNNTNNTSEDEIINELQYEIDVVNDYKYEQRLKAKEIIRSLD